MLVLVLVLSQWIGSLWRSVWSKVCKSSSSWLFRRRRRRRRFIYGMDGIDGIDGIDGVSKYVRAHTRVRLLVS